MTGEIWRCNCHPTCTFAAVYGEGPFSSVMDVVRDYNHARGDTPGDDRPDLADFLLFQIAVARVLTEPGLALQIEQAAGNFRRLMRVVGGIDIERGDV